MADLRELCNASLLEFDREVKRYFFHPLLSEYIKEKTKTIADEVSFENQKLHSNYYLLEQLCLITEGNQEQKNKALTFLKLEQANLQAAWLFASKEKLFDVIHKSAHALERFSELTSHYAWGSSLLEQTTKELRQHTEAHPAALSNVKASRAWLLQRLGNYVEAITLAEQALGIAEPVDDYQGQTTALNVLGVTHRYMGNFEKSRTAYNKALMLVEERAGAYIVALANLAAVDIDLGNYDDAVALLEKAYQLANEQSKAQTIPLITILLGKLYLFNGQLEKAKSYLRQGYNLSKHQNYHHWLMVHQLYFAWLAIEEHNFGEAKTLGDNLYTQLIEQSNQSLLVDVLYLLGSVNLYCQNYPVAQDYLTKSANLAYSLGEVPQVNKALIYLLELWIIKDSKPSVSWLSTYLLSADCKNSCIKKDLEKLQSIVKKKSIQDILEQSDRIVPLTLSEIIEKLDVYNIEIGQSK